VKRWPDGDRSFATERAGPRQWRTAMATALAGEHFTPREVIRLKVNLLFIEDD
jgi:hypothetical protein